MPLSRRRQQYVENVTRKCRETSRSGLLTDLDRTDKRFFVFRMLRCVIRPSVTPHPSTARAKWRLGSLKFAVILEQLGQRGATGQST